MRTRTFAGAVTVLALLAAPAYAVDKPAGAPAAPSGAPKEAAESGSSLAGKDGSVNEMRSQEKNREENAKMSDPNKNK